MLSIRVGHHAPTVIVHPHLMIEISLRIRCENAEDNAARRAQDFADAACARMERGLRAFIEQGAVTITKSVTVTQEISAPTGTTSSSIPDSAPSQTQTHPFQGPSLNEPGLDEPALTEPPVPPSAATELTFSDLTPQEYLISTLKQLLIDAEEVARRRGDPSLCDSITPEGNPYPSQHILEVLTTIDNEGYEPL